MAIVMRINRGAKLQVYANVRKAVTDVFTLDIKPDAVLNSPVTPEGLAYNQAKRPGKQLTDVGGTGTNRRSIDVDVIDTAKGVQAQIYTQSGYGGYLETGTGRMRAQPYIWPAFKKYMGKISELVRKLNR